MTFIHFLLNSILFKFKRSFLKPFQEMSSTCVNLVPLTDREGGDKTSFCIASLYRRPAGQPDRAHDGRHGTACGTVRSVLENNIIVFQLNYPFHQDIFYLKISDSLKTIQDQRHCKRAALYLVGRRRRVGSLGLWAGGRPAGNNRVSYGRR